MSTSRTPPSTPHLHTPAPNPDSDSDSSSNADTSPTIPLLPPPSSRPPNHHHTFLSLFRYHYHPSLPSTPTLRTTLRTALSSRTQHILILLLVTLDLLGIFADLFLALYICEDLPPPTPSTPTPPFLLKIRDSLSLLGLTISCIFVAELLLSIFAFGWRYFRTWFHVLDACVIVAGFVVDVLLHGVLEEVASLVVVLRFWRFFKILEEFGVGAQEEMDGLYGRIGDLEEEVKVLRGRLEEGRKGGGDQEGANAV